MDDHDLIDQLRAQGERFDDDAHGTDVDALVHGALVRGRRQRTRRRVTGAVAGVVVAGLAVVGVVAVGPSVLRGGVPVTPPVAGSPAPQTIPPPAATRRPTSTPTPTAVTGRVSGTPAQARTLLIGLLPESVTVTDSSAAREEGGNGFEWENNVAVTVEDDEGTSYLYGGVGDGLYTDGCFNLENCETTSLPDGSTLWITSGPPGDKTGVDRSFSYNRPDGGHVWFTERNFLGGNDPVSRPGLPFSDAVGRGIVTSPTWDVLFQG